MSLLLYKLHFAGLRLKITFLEESLILVNKRATEFNLKYSREGIWEIPPRRILKSSSFIGKEIILFQIKI